MYNNRHISQPSFGSAITDMQYVNDTNRSYRYGFNGEEKENSIDGEGMVYDLGARFYDGRLGRMFSCDPIEFKYPFWSPYSYCGNSPISIVDIDGMGTGDETPTPTHNDIRRISGVLEIYDANVVIKNPDGTETKGAWVQPSANLSAYISNKYAKGCQFGKDDGGDFSSSIQAMSDYTIKLYSTGNKYSAKEMNDYSSVTQDILLSNGVLTNFEFISPEEASKQCKGTENLQDNVLYYDINNFGNFLNLAPFGLTNMYPSGIQVVDLDKNAGDGSYINCLRIKSEASTFGLNVTFLTGYIMAHEILHGLIVRTSYVFKGINMGLDPTQHSKTLSLNFNGEQIDFNLFKNYQFVPQYNATFPLLPGFYPSNPYTTIIPIQLNYIKKYLNR